MIAFYLDHELSEDELVEVQLAVGEAVDQVRIPWLLPADRHSGPPRVEPELVRPHLRRAGIDRRGTSRVALVAPLNTPWILDLCEAIQLETGHYPLLVQTPRHRRWAGHPGPLRVVDLDAYIRDDDATSRPPWLDDGLFPDLR